MRAMGGCPLINIAVSVTPLTTSSGAYKDSKVTLFYTCGAIYSALQ